MNLLIVLLVVIVLLGGFGGYYGYRAGYVRSPAIRSASAPGRPDPDPARRHSAAALGGGAT